MWPSIGSSVEIEPTDMAKLTFLHFCMCVCTHYIYVYIHVKEFGCDHLSDILDFEDLKHQETDLQIPHDTFHDISFICRWGDRFCLHCNIFIYIRHIWIKLVLCSRMVSLFHHTSH